MKTNLFYLFIFGLNQKTKLLEQSNKPSPIQQLYITLTSPYSSWGYVLVTKVPTQNMSTISIQSIPIRFSWILAARATVEKWINTTHPIRETWWKIWDSYKAISPKMREKIFYEKKDDPHPHYQNQVNTFSLS